MPKTTSDFRHLPNFSDVLGPQNDIICRFRHELVTLTSFTKKLLIKLTEYCKTPNLESRDKTLINYHYEGNAHSTHLHQMEPVFGESGDGGRADGGSGGNRSTALLRHGIYYCIIPLQHVNYCNMVP